MLRTKRTDGWLGSSRATVSSIFLALLLALVPSIALAIVIAAAPAEWARSIVQWKTMNPAFGAYPNVSRSIFLALLNVSPATFSLLLFPAFAVLFLERINRRGIHPSIYITPQKRRIDTRRFLRRAGFFAIAIETLVLLATYPFLNATRLLDSSVMIFTGAKVSSRSDTVGFWMYDQLLHLFGRKGLPYESFLILLGQAHVAITIVLAIVILCGACHLLFSERILRVLGSFVLTAVGCVAISAYFTAMAALFRLWPYLAIPLLIIWIVAVWYFFFRLQRRPKTAYVEFPGSDSFTPGR